MNYLSIAARRIQQKHKILLHTLVAYKPAKLFVKKVGGGFGGKNKKAISSSVALAAYKLINQYV